MINWFDMPAEGLSNGGLFEVKELEVTENGTYETKGEMYNKVTVNVEGGGSSWQTVFEGSVETVDDDGDIFGIIENLTLTGDSIKATLNGTEYILPKTEHGYGAENESGLDFSTYPLFIAPVEGVDSCNLWTPTAGTYTLKIEEPQSGGSSDFSTAEVTITNNSGNEIKFFAPFYNAQYKAIQSFMGTNTEEPTINSTIIVPTGGMVFMGAEGLAQFTPQNTTTTGNATVENGELIITGDCTITIS